MIPKEVYWVGSSKKDLLNLPDEVVRFMGYALHLAQMGQQHKSTRVLKGFGGADVIEIIDMDETGTYRTVYTVRMRDAIVEDRLKRAEKMYKEGHHEK